MRGATLTLLTPLDPQKRVLNGHGFWKQAISGGLARPLYKYIYEVQFWRFWVRSSNRDYSVFFCGGVTPAGGQLGSLFTISPRWGQH